MMSNPKSFIKNYDFKDLAKFVDDLKFLLGRDNFDVFGGASKSLGTTLILWRIIYFVVFIILFIIIIYIISIVFKILFQGYSRFFSDLVKLQFSRKLNIQSELGGANGLLFKHIYDMTDDDTKVGINHFERRMVPFTDIDCESRNCQTVFQSIVDNIESLYSTVTNTEKIETAIMDYYLYNDVIYNSLGLKGENIFTAKMKIKKALEDMLPDYFQTYADLISKDLDVQCVIVEGDTTNRRNEKEQLRNQKKSDRNNAYKTYGIKVVQTSKKFAEKYLDVEMYGQCGRSIQSIFNNELNKSSYERLRKKVIQFDQKIKEINVLMQRASAEQLKTLNQQLNALTKGRSQAFINLAVVRKQAMLQALDIQRREQNEANKKMVEAAKKSSYKEGFYRRQGIINYEDESYNIPNRTEVDGVFFKVYIPHYRIYERYYENNSKLYAYLTKGEDPMTKEQIIAYIFLKDLEDTLETFDVNDTDNKNKQCNVTDVTEEVYVSASIVERLILNCWGFDKLAYTIKFALMNAEDLIIPCQYLYIERDSKIEIAIQDIIANKTRINNAFLNNDFTSIIVKDHYAYYLMELFMMFSSSLSNSSLYKTYQKQIEVLLSQSTNSTKLQNPLRKNTIMTYLNLPDSIKANPNTIKQFEISYELDEFMKCHPLFTITYLSDSEDIYQSIINLLQDIVNKQKSVKTSVSDISKVNTNTLTSIVNYIGNEVFSIKKTITCLNIINLYFSNYKNDLLAKNISDIEVQKLIQSKTLKERDGGRLKSQEELEKTRKDNNKTMNKGNVDGYLQFVPKEGYMSLLNEQNIPSDFEGFFRRLAKPFFEDFIKNRVVGTWKRTFHRSKFDVRNQGGYWREFNSLYIDYLGRQMKSLRDSTWRKMSEFAKPRWGKMSEFG
jgi:hypothetical protein